MTSPTAKILGCFGAEVGIDRDAAAGVGFDAGGCEVQVVNVAGPGQRRREERLR